MFKPASTYRLQFNKDFTFSHLERIIPYLSALGVDTIYASPVFAAVPGSVHGYDITSPLCINPEIGTEEELFRISAKLRAHGLHWIQDIVPNHMAYHYNNIWLRDVLENGQGSEYAEFFDIRWETGKLMAPFLDASLEEVIGNEQLRLREVDGHFVLDYKNVFFPLSKASLEIVYACGTDLQSCAVKINSNPDLMKLIAGEQYYRLCEWKETNDHINYRRFFTVNGLIGLNMEHRKVFDRYHEYIKYLLHEGIFQGLRVDHVDGLSDPGLYLGWLRELAGDDAYIVVEKILQHDEEVPANWPVQGTTGYDFLSMVNNLLTFQKGEETLTRLYAEIIGADVAPSEQIHEKKSAILFGHMKGELDHLREIFTGSFPEQAGRVEAAHLTEAIGMLLVELPYYRLYPDCYPVSQEDAVVMKGAASRIIKGYPHLAKAVDVIMEVLMGTGTADDLHGGHVLRFFKRCMQLSGPLMAKGVEDTVMYSYNRFTGHNDVGDTPVTFGLTQTQFHELMVRREKMQRYSINATSTHDTKRGEDVRARLNVITAFTAEWAENIRKWRVLNSHFKRSGIPGNNEEYLIYQLLTGIYNHPAEPGLKERLGAYLQKALREAGEHTSWQQPDKHYEEEAVRFMNVLLNREHDFYPELLRWSEKVRFNGITNSFAQLVLKFTCPGIPDLYQGTELWDLSLVDPDNRKTVDYEKREQLLDEISDAENERLLFGRLWKQREDGKIKLWLTHKLLHVRKMYSELFTEGVYIPLRTEGKFKDHLLAFARRNKDQWNVTIVPLHLYDQDLTDFEWQDTFVVLPNEAPLKWVNAFTGTHYQTTSRWPVHDIFDGLPVVVVMSEKQDHSRSAGILMHVSSLPSPFGIGDFGPEAKKFARFLARAGQQYWQVLPLNVTNTASGHSPYSSVSAIAGNPLFISPEMLADEGLLDHEQVNQCKLDITSKVDYEMARKIKYDFLGKAYRSFQTLAEGNMKHRFQSFCERESSWLDDYALYVVIREAHEFKPWYEWPEEYRNRDKQSLEIVVKNNEDEIMQVKWRQYIFFRQWQELKQYCNALNINILGDLPFYMNADSADVWANREIFNLTKEGMIDKVAGVPPDYFSENGQLWNMPTFRWDILKEKNYKWWIGRLRKNMELFDLLRIDHFRAFESYWEVPGGEKTAKNGKWIKGPGMDFFNRVKDELGELPFVVEDLGDQMDDVYMLRDKTGFPGMKVLQFGFGDNFPEGVDVPHNFTTNCIVYTGTHDNNTTLGWFRHELDGKGRKRLEEYTGTRVNSGNVHIVLARLAYASVAKIVILPVQDVIGLDETTRMNVPGSDQGNWLWRLLPGQLTSAMQQRLLTWAACYNRK